MKPYGLKKQLLISFVVGLMATSTYAVDDSESENTFTEEEYSANFKGVDIHEFINIVSKNLEQTIILDPSVRGKISVRSYEMLNAQQYYQFFLSVLEVYGFAAVDLNNGVIKIIRAKKAKASAIRIADAQFPGSGDEMVTRIVPLYNVAAKQLAPLLRQLNDNSGGGNVVNYDPSNVLMITGRAAVVNKLVDIVKRVDKQGDSEAQVIVLKNASAGELVRIIERLNRTTARNRYGKETKVVADERTNSLIVTGDKQSRKRVLRLAKKLDSDLGASGNTKVRYLRYAKAEDLVDVLLGYSKTLTDKSKAGSKTNSKSSRSSSSSSSSKNGISIVAHKETNALVITAEPDDMKMIEGIIRQLDIKRAQVLIEAIIVEVKTTNASQLGVEWGTVNPNHGIGVVQGQSDPKISSLLPAMNDPNNSTAVADAFSALGNTSGMALAFKSGDWASLLKASVADTSANLLATPQVTTLDNQEASFFSGQEVSVQTTSQTSSSNGNPYATYDRQKVGTKLKVTPQINEGDAIKLIIEQEASNVVGTSTNAQPTFSERTLSTTVMVQSDQIVVIGGLLRDDVMTTESKVPLLGDIPLLGFLFRTTADKIEKINMMVFIKAKVIANESSASEVYGHKYNYLRAMQLNNEDNGIKPWLRDGDPSVLQPWQKQTFVPEDIQNILNKYKLKNTLAPAASYLAPDIDSMVKQTKKAAQEKKKPAYSPVPEKKILHSKVNTENEQVDAP